jgi:GR25 family glycosyltransferase involved in LPS biosynthesis
MNNPFNFFDKIFCINLDDRQDRWIDCCKIFNKYEMMHKVERFSALKFTHQDPRLIKVMGQIGCSMSHFGVLKKAKEQNLNNFLVLEDDFCFEFEPFELFEKMNSSLLELPNNWNMFYLGGNLDSSYNVDPIEKYSDNLFKLNACHTTHAFAVNKNIYDVILKDEPTLDELPSWHNKYTVIDVYFSKAILSKNNCFITNPILSLQRPGFSNIEHNNYDYRFWMLQNFNNFKNKLNK